MQTQDEIRNSGDYIEPDRYYSADELGLSIENDKVKLWVEAALSDAEVAHIKATFRFRSSYELFTDTVKIQVSDAVDMDVPGVPDEREEEYGALVVKVDGGNAAPPLPVTLQKPDASMSGESFELLKVGAEIRVFEDEAMTTEITFVGGDNVFAYSDLPKTLYVKGETASTSSQAANLTFQQQGDPTVIDTIAYTVAWFDVTSRVTGTVSDDNAAKANYTTRTGGAGLGLKSSRGSTGADYLGIGIELKGQATPSDLDMSDFPGVGISFEREFVSYTTFSAGAPTNPGKGPGDSDTSEDAYVDLNPQSGGSAGAVYDLDQPGTEIFTSIGLTTSSARINFIQWVQFNIPGIENPVRASEEYQWFHRRSLVTSQSTGVTTFDNTYPNDNQSGAGTTPTTLNLQ